MSQHSLFSRFCYFPIPHRVAVMMVTLIALAWSSPAFCSEIHDAARDCDFAKIQALLKNNPFLVSSKDDNGLTSLHLAVFSRHREMAELLVANKADVDQPKCACD